MRDFYIYSEGISTILLPEGTKVDYIVNPEEQTATLEGLNVKGLFKELITDGGTPAIYVVRYNTGSFDFPFDINAEGKFYSVIYRDANNEFLTFDTLKGLIDYSNSLERKSEKNFNPHVDIEWLAGIDERDMEDDFNDDDF